MRRFLRPVAIVALVSAAAASATAAARPQPEQRKIDALLMAMQSSDAAFLRNGKEYDGRKAASHLKRKLTFAGSRVRTVRDFIDGIATRSSQTGEPYRVRSRDGSVRLLADWLKERLAAMEVAPTPPRAAPPGRAGGSGPSR
jgi:hypothetical protein